MDFFKHFGTGDPTPGAHWLPGMSIFVASGTLAYHLVGFRLWRRRIEQFYAARPWWSYLKTYKGLLCHDVQKEVQYLSIVGCHHLFGGGLMAYGTYAGLPHVWAAGALVGVFDDVHDSVCMLLPAWPFGGEGEKRDVKLVSLLLMHHFAAVVCTFPAILSGMHTNTHVQAIGAWLLLAGGISHGTLICSRTCNRKVLAEAKVDAAIWIFGGAFYTYSRLYAFPLHSYALFREEYAKLSPGMQKALIGFTVLMGAFNLLIFNDVMGNMMKRIKLVLRGGDKRS
mmetsp:Transcript_92461/g.233162  ORF Transcript_92461/g.233162 Transcript_92461/m.233162 type:complete len:282 (-) Transcript_92461:14-859(-)|eukprot:CAMPEP_0115561108 /NCGR_PEP_ID=MMETSP0271-20121206/100814_1 /TAXON_ID=71861 /ORGANISM="Scrippsiella trochoidea, Strain CCMP3099" /LENGTH=281 /DNA_ID=CAMNT_0002995205 /DNA_START=14 /DNA_END=859 /DNA_ORIENTATION=-